MKVTFSTLLKSVFLSSLTGIITKEGHALNKFRNIESSLDANARVNILESQNSNNLEPKLLLRTIVNDGWNVIAHRSHRSHSSHRSHYSHYSSSSRTPTNSRPSEKSSNSKNNGSGQGSVEQNSLLTPGVAGSNPRISATALRLGARTLKKGMSGTDVTELINILLKEKYLQLEGDSSQLSGISRYDETIEATVKQFQIDNGMTGDGVCGPLTIYFLKQKQKNDSDSNR